MGADVFRGAFLTVLGVNSNIPCIMAWQGNRHDCVFCKSATDHRQRITSADTGRERSAVPYLSVWEESASLWISVSVYGS